MSNFSSHKNWISFVNRIDGPVEISRWIGSGIYNTSKEWCTNIPYNEISHRVDGPSDIVKYYNHPDGMRRIWFVMGQLIDTKWFETMEIDQYDMTDAEILMFITKFQ